MAEVLQEAKREEPPYVGSFVGHRCSDVESNDSVGRNDWASTLSAERADIVHKHEIVRNGLEDAVIFGQSVLVEPQPLPRLILRLVVLVLGVSEYLEKQLLPFLEQAGAGQGQRNELVAVRCLLEPDERIFVLKPVFAWAVPE